MMAENFLYGFELSFKKDVKVRLLAFVKEPLVWLQQDVGSKPRKALALLFVNSGENGNSHQISGRDHSYPPDILVAMEP